jgi:hypothetical protein
MPDLGGLSLAASFNAWGESVAYWKALLREADPNVAVKHITECEGAILDILEVV